MGERLVETTLYRDGPIESALPGRFPVSVIVTCADKIHGSCYMVDSRGTPEQFEQLGQLREKLTRTAEEAMTTHRATGCLNTPRVTVGAVVLNLSNYL